MFFFFFFLFFLFSKIPFVHCDRFQRVIVVYLSQILQSNSDMNQGNRGRGRGRPQGRVRGRNAARLAVEALRRQQNHVLAPANDSDKEDSEPENIGRAHDNINVDEK